MTGLLDVADRVWPVLLFLALIQVVADLCDDAGLFDVSAHVAARVAGGSRLRLFLLFTLLATVCTWVLSIDTTAVLLAPIGLALAAELGLSALPFAFASIWLANAGEPAAARVQPDQPAGPVAPRHRRRRSSCARPGSPSWRCSSWSSACCWCATGSPCGEVRRADRVLPSYDPVLLWLAAAVVALIGPAILPGCPAWAVALVAAVGSVARFRRTPPRGGAPGRLVRLVPWSVIALRDRAVRRRRGGRRGGVVVARLALRHRRLAGLAAPARRDLGRLLANVVNNLPAYLVVEPFAGSADRLVTALVAVNVGPMLLAWGSLANLLWLRACRTRGLRISMVATSALEGLLVVPLAVAAGVLAVWLLGVNACLPS